MATRFGRQPALEYLRRDRWTIPLAARTIGVSEVHLKNVVYGRTRPMEKTKAGLAKLTGRPISELFTPGIVELPYKPDQNPWRVLA